MPSIAQAVKDIVREQPLLLEALERDILNFARVAEDIEPEVVRRCGSNASLSAIVMSLRRFGETLTKRIPKPKKQVFSSEIVLKSGLCDVTFVKTPSLIVLLPSLQSLSSQSSDTLHIIQGNNELTIVVSQRLEKEITKLTKKERILHIEKNLSSVTMALSPEFFYSPGVLAQASRALAWNGINVYENISTMTELIFIVSDTDALRAYDALKKLIT